MKLIKTFMAAALLSTAFAGMAFAADDHHDGERAEAHADAPHGFTRESSIDDLLAGLGLAQDDDGQITNLTVSSNVAGTLKALDPSVFEEGSEQAKLVVALRDIYGKLEAAAGSQETFMAEVDGANLTASFGIDYDKKDLGLGKKLTSLEESLGDPLKPYRKGGIADKLAKLASVDEGKNPLYRHYQGLLGGKKEDAKKAAEDLSVLFKTLGEQGVKVAEQGKEAHYIALDQYIEDETKTIAHKDHLKKLSELQKELHEAKSAPKLTAEQTIGGQIVTALFKNSGSLAPVKGSAAFKEAGFKLDASLLRQDAAKVSKALIDAFKELSQRVSSQAAAIKDLKEQLTSSSVHLGSGSHVVPGRLNSPLREDGSANADFGSNPYRGEDAF